MLRPAAKVGRAPWAARPTSTSAVTQRLGLATGRAGRRSQLGRCARAERGKRHSSGGAGQGGQGGGKMSTREIVDILMRYLWPKGQPWLKARVVLALSLMVGAKLITIQVPFLFKDIIDRLTPGGAKDMSDAEKLAMAVPVALVLGCEGAPPAAPRLLCAPAQAAPPLPNPPSHSPRPPRPSPRPQTASPGRRRPACRSSGTPSSPCWRSERSAASLGTSSST